MKSRRYRSLSLIALIALGLAAGAFYHQRVEVQHDTWAAAAIAVSVSLLAFGSVGWTAWILTAPNEPHCGRRVRADLPRAHAGRPIRMAIAS